MTVRAVVLVTTALAAPSGLRGFDLGNFFDEGAEDSFFSDGPFSFGSPLGAFGEQPAAFTAHSPVLQEAFPMGFFAQAMGLPNEAFPRDTAPGLLLGRMQMGDRSSSQDSFERTVKSPDGSFQSYSFSSSSFSSSGSASPRRSEIAMQLPRGMRPCRKAVVFVQQGHQGERRARTQCFNVEIDEANQQVVLTIFGAGMGERKDDAGAEEKSREQSSSQEVYQLPFALDHAGTKATYDLSTGQFHLKLAPKEIEIAMTPEEAETDDAPEQETRLEPPQETTTKEAAPTATEGEVEKEHAVTDEPKPAAEEGIQITVV